MFPYFQAELVDMRAELVQARAAGERSLDIADNNPQLNAHFVK